MSYQYQELLDPELYNRSHVAQFVANLLEPEVDTRSDEQVNELQQDMASTDHIQSIIESLAEELKAQHDEGGTVPPTFISYINPDHRIKMHTNYHIPTKPINIRRFLAAGKALSMIRKTQCTFFCTMQLLHRDQPAFGEMSHKCTDQGLFIVGSSLRGNCFVHISKLCSSGFKHIDTHITRDRNQDYPFSRFYEIQNENEMTRIIEQIPKLMARSGIAEQECIVNFATTLKALKLFGYDN